MCPCGRETQNLSLSITDYFRGYESCGDTYTYSGG